MTQIAVDPSLFTWPSDEPRLIGSKCADCGVVTFPRQQDCPRCTGDRMEEELFERRGTLWTFTTQGFAPKSPPYAVVENPATFQPYGVGYVEFPGQARVEGRLTESDPKKLRIGMEMETVVIPFMQDAEGNEVMTYAFRPVV
jgi:uncharacterized OB-fold protein